MQEVAKEQNLSETSFLHLQGRDYHLRWFSPAVEVDLCGHATLASAHVLWEEGHLPASAEARFQTRSGLLSARRQGDWMELNLPSEPESEITRPASLFDTLVNALGSTPKYVGKNRLDYLVELESEEAVRKLNPDPARIKTLPVRGVIVTSRCVSPPYDFVSRYFAPALGIPEDPVTGSAHCCLGPFWRARLGKDELLARQISPRGGVIRMRFQEDRVLLGGKAVTVRREVLDE